MGMSYRKRRWGIFLADGVLEALRGSQWSGSLETNEWKFRKQLSPSQAFETSWGQWKVKKKLISYLCFLWLSSMFCLITWAIDESSNFSSCWNEEWLSRWTTREKPLILLYKNQSINQYLNGLLDLLLVLFLVVRELVVWDFVLDRRRRQSTLQLWTWGKIQSGTKISFFSGDELRFHLNKFEFAPSTAYGKGGAGKSSLSMGGSCNDDLRTNLRVSLRKTYVSQSYYLVAWNTRFENKNKP